jgi:competence protein ComEC
VASWPAAVLAVPHMAPWGLAALALGMAWLGLWRSRPRLAGVALIGLALASPALSRAPDLLVSDNAGLIGWRTGGQVFVQRASGGSDFTEHAWLQLWAAPAATAPECGGPSCVIRRRPEVVLLRGPPDAAACTAALVISAEPVELHCEVPKIDRFTVYREGAQAVWLGPGGVRVVSDRAYRGERPWVIPVPTRTGIPRGVKLTPARAEVLPEE